MRACLSWCCLQLDDVFFPKHTITGWWFFSLSTLMLQKWCTHSMGYACISSDDVSYRSSMFLSICAQTTSNAWTVLLMKPVVGRRYLDNAYKPKTWCRVDAHTPWLIRVGLGWFFLHLANIGFMMITSLGWCCLMLDDENVVQSMHKSHERCVESLADAAFHSTTFLAEWLHSTSDA